MFIAASAALLVILFAAGAVKEANSGSDTAGVARDGRTAANTLQEDSLFREIRFFLHPQKNEYVKLFLPADGIWTAFLPAEFSDRTFTVSLPAGAALTVGDLTLQDGDRVTAAGLQGGSSEAGFLTNADIGSAVSCAVTRGGRTEEGKLRIMQAHALPALYVLMAENGLSAMHEDIAREERGMYSIRTAEGTDISSGRCSMHGRGNYSWDREQKPYSFQTQANISILGMGAAKHYNLISNYMGGIWELRNRFALETARRIGMEGTPDGRFLDLYVNGEYQGVYFLTEKVRPRGEYFLEMDYRHQKEPFAVYVENPAQENLQGEKQTQDSAAVGAHYVINDLREPDNAQIDRIRAQLQEAVSSLGAESARGSTGTPEDGAYEAYFDTSSWARMYAVQEYFVNWDYDYASLFLYRDAAAGKFFAGPAWDLEWIAGKLYAGDYFDLTAHTRWIDDTVFEDRNMHNGGILKLLGQHHAFHDEADRVLLEELIPAADALAEKELRTWAKELESSVAMEAVRWGRDSGQYAEELAVFEKWLEERSAFLEEQITQPQSFEKKVTAFAWGKVTEYKK